MRGLYLRIISSAVLAIVIAWLAVGLLSSQFRSRFDPRAQGPGGPGGPIRWIATQLDGLSEEEWPARLAEAQREMAIPLSIVKADALPREAASQVTVPRPMFVDDGRGGRSMFVPIRGGAYYMVAAPPAPPPPWPLIAGSAIFVCVLTLTASAVVGIPLVRRLQMLRHAIVELGNGNWAVRVTPRGGVLGELAESITRTASQLQRQFQEREALLQVASHEIGTPLSRMRFELAMLEERLVNERDLRRVRALVVDLDELDSLSTDLVAWMETDAGSRATRDVLALGPLLQLLAELEHHAAGKRVRVDVRVEPDVTAFVDQRQFQRAIENLLRNAFRYAQALIVVEVWVTEDKVAVEVRDDGPGIPPEQWTTVLEPFVRVDSAPTRAHRGLGLGLAIVRRIVDAHGGGIALTSAGEGGTCVRTVWPRAAQESTPTGSAGAPSERSQPQN
jgi:signal transduction histidine kinase